MEVVLRKLYSWIGTRLIWDGIIRRRRFVMRRFSLRERMISRVLLHVSSLIMVDFSILLIIMVLRMFAFNHKDMDGNLKVKRTNMSVLIFQINKHSTLWT